MHPINPTTGLPMIGDDYSGLDVGGNPYGTTSNHYPWSSNLPQSHPWLAF